MASGWTPTETVAEAGTPRMVAASTDSGPVVQAFREKRNEDGSYINGGYFVLQPEVIDYIDGKDFDDWWERESVMLGSEVRRIGKIESK